MISIFWGIKSPVELLVLVTPRLLALQGPSETALRRSVAGKFLKLQSQVPAEPGGEFMG